MFWTFSVFFPQNFLRPILSLFSWLLVYPPFQGGLPLASLAASCPEACAPQREEMGGKWVVASK